MPNRFKLAIVAAMEREVRGLVKTWPTEEREYDGRRFLFFEHESTVLVCGGMGAVAARRAAEAVIALYHPQRLQSVGFAGALDASLKAGALFVPECIVDTNDGSRTETHTGSGVLVSFPSIAGVQQKEKLAAAYAAQAVDMEAAAVARAAAAHGVAFTAVKAISDGASFNFPDMERFVASGGSFRQASFVLHAAVRPWLWPAVLQLASNSAKASKTLCNELNTANLAADQFPACIQQKGNLNHRGRC